MKTAVCVWACMLIACSSKSSPEAPAASGGTTGIGAGGTLGAGGSTGTGGATGHGGSAVPGTGGKAGATGQNGGAGGAGTSAELVNPPPGSKFFVGANFWRIDWEGSADFFQSNVDWTTVDSPWQPQLLADLAPYKVLRFMDWNQTNGTGNSQADWTTRKKKTDAQNEPVAFELHGR